LRGYQDIAHLSGLHISEVEQVIGSQGRACYDCLAQSSLNKSSCEQLFATQLCGDAHCTKEVGGLMASKCICACCGSTFCKDHSIDKHTVGHNWLDQNEHFPNTKYLCFVCLHENNSTAGDAEFPHHPKTTYFRLLAGNASGQNIAIVVHGVMSGYASLQTFSRALVKQQCFDAVWTVDDVGYKQRVNQSMGFTSTDLLSAIPSSLTSIGTLSAIGPVVMSELSTVVDLPSYIIEGAAQSLDNAIKSIDCKNATLIGHSLGGMVARCTVESYDLSNYIDNVITLGSPQYLWLMFNTPALWRPRLNGKHRYLVLVGNQDRVVLSKDWASKIDPPHENLLNILIDGADHTTIHSNPHKTYIMELIKSFAERDIPSSSEDKFFVWVDKGEAFLGCSKIHNKQRFLPVEATAGSKQWLSFSPLVRTPDRRELARKPETSSGSSFESLNGGNFTDQEYINALEKLKGRDKVGVAGQALGIGLSAAAGVTASSTAAGLAGASTLLGSSTLGAALGGVFVAATPIGWVIGCAAAAGAVGYGITSLVRSGAEQDSTRADLRKSIANKHSQKHQRANTRNDEFISLLQVKLKRGLISQVQSQALLKMVNDNELDVNLAITRLSALRQTDATHR